MPRLRIAPEAQRDIDGIYEYGIRNFGLPQADRYMRELGDLLGVVERNPLIGRERDEVRPPVRLLRFRSHHAFYDIENADVMVVRVLHHSADWMSSL